LKMDDLEVPLFLFLVGVIVGYSAAIFFLF